MFLFCQDQQLRNTVQGSSKCSRPIVDLEAVLYSLDQLCVTGESSLC